MVDANEIKKNNRLTQYDEVRELVIANAVKDVPALKKSKGTGRNASLSQY